MRLLLKMIAIGLIKLSIHNMYITILKVARDFTSNSTTNEIGVYDTKNEVDTIKATINTRLFCLVNAFDRGNLENLILYIITM